MNLTKRLFSLLTAFVMALALATPIKAADEYKIVVDNSRDGHTYEAYQIFDGELTKNSDGQPVLSNVTWAEGVAAKEEGAQLPDAVDVAKQLEEGTLTLDQLLAMIDLGAVDATDDFKDGKYELTGLKAGYYLVKDQDGSLTLDHDAYTDYIIKVVENITVTPKNVYPTVDKQVWDEPADAEGGVTSGWNETADHHLNETFQFKLIATLPASLDYAAYETYNAIFEDTMSAGVTFERIVSVVVDDITLTTEQYTCSATANQAGGSWSLTIVDLKTIAGVNLTNGAIIEVIYDAHLNEDAVIGNIDENLNEVYLKYSNNPNASGEGDHEYGQTPEDTVWVFTYKANVTKVDGQDNTKKLDGAEFKLRAEDGKWVIVDANGKVTGWANEEKDGSTLVSVNGVFAVIGLDHGKYYLKETKAPTGYNVLKEEKEVIITANHKEVDADNAETLYNGTLDPNVNVTVENNTGATLPETGGMGTTLIYLIGGTLAVLSILLMVTKKRMNG